jgi:1,4-dihydroxy-2-naphthoate octaprenyltransferase
MLKRFLHYVEIRTKITSTFTFALTIGFLLYQNQSINWTLTAIFFASMFLFDLTTTAINNYIDSKTNDQILQFSRKTAVFIIYCLLGISTALGLYLVYLSDIVILLAGGLCFLCGIFYTYGPQPISRQPYGEIFSGFFYGGMIPFILMYINTPVGTFLNYHLSLESVSLELKVIPIITLVLLAVIPFCVTANIMLANNICDLDKDIEVNRYTLPYYIGKKSLLLFTILNYLPYVSMIIMVASHILHPVCLLSLISIYFVQKNINIFLRKQEKAVTFICSINNFMIIMGSMIATIFISIIIR